MFDTKTLKSCYAWGWIDDAYLDRLVELGQVSAEDLPEIKGTITGKKIVSMSK